MYNRTYLFPKSHLKNTVTRLAAIVVSGTSPPESTHHCECGHGWVCPTADSAASSYMVVMTIWSTV